MPRRPRHCLESDRRPRRFHVDDALRQKVLEMHLEGLHAVGMRPLLDEVFERRVRLGALECFAHGAGEITTFTFDALARATTFMPGANALLVSIGRINRDATQYVQDTTNVQIVGPDILHQWLQAYTPAPSPGRPQFLSCFISYSQHDLDFASELYARLRTSGVRVWFAPEDLLPGDQVYPQIQAAIAGVDKLIVILSDQSIGSSWVRAELRNAYQREVLENQRVLLPIRLVAFEKLRPWEWFEADFARDLASAVRDYYIPDFSGWRDPNVFQRGLEQLLRALRRGDQDAA